MCQHVALPCDLPSCPLQTCCLPPRSPHQTCPTWGPAGMNRCQKPAVTHLEAASDELQLIDPRDSRNRNYSRMDQFRDTVFRFTKVCPGSPRYVQVYQGVSRLTRVCPGLPRCPVLPRCPGLPRCVQVYQDVLRFTKVCPGLPRCVQICQGVSRFAKVCPGLGKFP